MVKKESPEKQNKILNSPQASNGLVNGVKSKISWLSNYALVIIKLILGLCFLAFVYSTSVSFLNEFSVVEAALQNYFWAGVISFIIIYLFIYEPVIAYQKGQRLLEAIFRFFAPLVKLASYLLPIYSIIIFILYLVLSLLVKSRGLIHYFLFAFGFSMALHLIFSAKTLRSKQRDILKSHYIFGFSFVYVINLIWVAFSLNLTFEKFSLVNFSNNSFQIARDIFYAVFKQLFLP